MDDEIGVLRAPKMLWLTLEFAKKQWALVLAGISDFARPAEKLSFTQNFALTCTGLIWTRWCLIIKPKNYLYVPTHLPSSSPRCVPSPAQRRQPQPRSRSREQQQSC